MARITRSEHDGVEARDFSWLVGALDQLRTARRVLCNSYAFGECTPRSSRQRMLGCSLVLCGMWRHTSSAFGPVC
jgi:hypothetical protein